MKLFTPEDIREYFYASCLLAIICLILAVIAIGESGQANVNELSISGQGDMQARTDTVMASDFASAKGSGIAYESKRTWGIPGAGETFSSSFLIASASSDGKWKNTYRIKGSGVGHKVSFQATKITGDASFAGEISLAATEAGDTSFDSVVEFDTRDGNATISGRAYNSTAGRPATMQELDAVGKFILRHHLNVSQPAMVPENWLPSCSELDKDMILDPSTRGIYVAPLNTSRYNYVWDGAKVGRQLNTTGQV
jgi:hypothetical protein